MCVCVCSRLLARVCVCVCVRSRNIRALASCLTERRVSERDPLAVGVLSYPVVHGRFRTGLFCNNDNND